jgi:hypothetical protein
MQVLYIKSPNRTSDPVACGKILFLMHFIFRIVWNKAACNYVVLYSVRKVQKRIAWNGTHSLLCILMTNCGYCFSVPYVVCRVII